MSCKVLNRLWINSRIEKVGNVSVPQLMWSNLKIQAVNHLAIMSYLFFKNRGNRMFYTLSIFVPII